MNEYEMESNKFYDSLDEKKAKIIEQLNYQNQKKNILFEYCNTIMNVISVAKNVDNDWDEILKELKETMEIISINTQELKELKKSIESIENLSKEIEKENDQEKKNEKIKELVERLEKYNHEEAQEFTKIVNKTKQNEDLINKIIKNANEILARENEEEEKEEQEVNKVNDEKLLNENINEISILQNQPDASCEQENKLSKPEKVGLLSGKITNHKKTVEYQGKKEVTILDDNKKDSIFNNSEAQNIIENITPEKLKDNRTLIVSEMEGKVYLPYYAADIIELMKESKNKTVEEIIKEKYIMNISKFKNPITARFRESYNLVRKKEKKGFIEAIDLGLELMLNYSLNPAVIAACKNEDELDIYLDCLEENELEQFEIFNIKYISAPMIINKKLGRHAYE